MAGKIKFIGISGTEKGALESQSPDLTTNILEITAKSMGKLFVAVQTLVEGPVTMGMQFNGEEVCIRDNEKLMHTNAVKTGRGDIHAYAIDLPMRYVGNEDQIFPANHVIDLFWAEPDLIRYGWNGSARFVLTLTGIRPEPQKYNPKTDGD